MAFFFDLKNSQFIRQDFFRKLEDGSHETVATFEFEYMDVDGWLFPKMHVMNFFERKSQHPTHQIRSIISPENVKINKPLDASIFIPKIPAGARIRDKVSGKIYRASGISDEKKEELIAKELDRIFEEAQQKK